MVDTFCNANRTRKIVRVSDTGSWTDSVWTLVACIHGVWERVAQGSGTDPRATLSF
jgi:hypothetical protein